MRIPRTVVVLVAAGFFGCGSNPVAVQDKLPDIVRNGSANVVPAGRIRINIPYFGSSEIAFGQCAIFWFGQVRMTDNYADIRIGYNDRELFVYAAVFDRLIWFDENPHPDSLTTSDAVTLLISREENASGLSSGVYRFIGQMSGDSAAKYRRCMIGSGGTWRDTTVAFRTVPGWRGDALNNRGEDRGWALSYRIPFSALGLNSAPTGGTTWRMAMILHDRDDAAKTAIAPKNWPNDSLDTENPSTWARICFGLPRYTPLGTTVVDSVMIRDRHESVEVKELSVGGSSVCGDGRDFFSQWGDMNDPENRTLVVQNQADIADWPCFSKIFFAFPLKSIARNRGVVSATLAVYLFGGSDPANAKPSWIQALVISPWDSAVTTWNNSPVVVENIGGTWVRPCVDFPGWPGVRYEWDVSYAVAQALLSNRDTLYLGLYSADSEYHSGKYFAGATDDGWNEGGRPTIVVRLDDGVGPR